MDENDRFKDAIKFILMEIVIKDIIFIIIGGVVLSSTSLFNLLTNEMHKNLNIFH